MAFGGEIDKLFVLIGAKSSMTQDLKSVEGDVKGFERRVETTGTKMDAHWGKVFKSIAKYAAVGFAALGTGVGLLGKQMLEGAGQVEKYRAILETVTGSAQTAGEKLDWLREFAKKTPFELPGLMEAATKLEAYGFKAEQYMGTLGDTAAALGKDVGDAVEALADATMGEFERLKEFGIKATTEGAQVAFNYVDKSGQQQKKLVDKNNKEAIASTLQAIWNERYAGAMEKMSQTWEGMVSNLKDAWTSGLADVGTSIMPTMKPFLEELIEFVGGDTFTGMLTDVAGAFVDLAEAAMGIFEKLAPSLGDIAGYFGDIVEKFAPMFGDVLGKVGELGAKIVGIFIESGVADSLLEVVDTLATTFVDALENMLPLIELVADAFNLWLNVFGKVLEVWSDIVGVISSAVGQAIDQLTFWDNAEKAIEKTKDRIAELESGWDDLTQAEREATLAQLEYAIQVFKSTGQPKEQIQLLVDEYQQLSDMLNSNIKDVEDWEKDYEDLMDRASEATEADLNQMYENFKREGANMVKEGRDIPDSILAHWQEQNPAIIGAMEATMQGAVSEVAEAVGLSKEQAAALSTALSDMLQTYGGDLTKFTEADYQAIAQLSHLSVDQVKEAINTIAGLQGPAAAAGDATGRAYGDNLMAQLWNLEAEARRWVAHMFQLFARTFTAHVQMITHQSDHEGGLVFHEGGIIPSMHYGGLSPQERIIRAEVGEYIMRKEAVRTVGVPYLAALNAGIIQSAGTTITQDFRGSTFTLGNVREPRDFDNWLDRKAQEAVLRNKAGQS